MSGCLTKAGSVLCLALLIGYGVLWSNLVQQSGGAENYVRGHDFLATLTGAAVVAGPRPALLYDPGAQESAQAAILAGDLSTPFHPYSNPPFAAILLAPLLRAHLAYSLVFTAWAVLTTAAAGLSIGLLAGRWPAPRGTPWLLMLAATSFLPLIASLMLGQQTMLALLGWIGLAAGLKAGRAGVAGCAAALAVFQPETLPLLLLLLVLTARWRTLVTLAGTLALAALALAPVLGPAWPLAYAGLLLHNGSPDPGTLAALLVAAILLLAVWWPRGRGPAAGWRPATLAWDLRWTLSLLALLPAAFALQPASLVLAILPGWILATALAGGGLAGAQARVWGLWLLLGYALAPASILISPVFAWAGVLWWAGAVAGLALNLWASAVIGPGPAPPPAEAPDPLPEAMHG